MSKLLARFLSLPRFVQFLGVLLLFHCFAAVVFVFVSTDPSPWYSVIGKSLWEALGLMLWPLAILLSISWHSIAKSPEFFTGVAIGCGLFIALFWFVIFKMQSNWRLALMLLLLPCWLFLGFVAGVVIGFGREWLLDLMEYTNN